MAVTGIAISANFPGLEQLKKDLRSLGDPRAMSLILSDALRKAIVPAKQRLLQVTPVGPTGNLKRAVRTKVKQYPKNGGAVALVGYERSGEGGWQSAQGGSVGAGKDRGFHQWWLEFGTKPRKITEKSITPYKRRGYTRRLKTGTVVNVSPHTVEAGQNQYIASSFNRLGPFKMLKTERGPDGRRGVKTDPGYPNAFFKASKTPFEIPATPAGGVARVPPVRETFESTSSEMASILARELRMSLTQAWDALTYRDGGSITGA